MASEEEGVLWCSEGVSSGIRDAVDAFCLFLLIIVIIVNIVITADIIIMPKPTPKITVATFDCDVLVSK